MRDRYEARWSSAPVSAARRTCPPCGQPASTSPRLVGRDAARTAQRAARVGVPSAFTSLTEALTRTDADAVVVATPPNTHAELVLEAVAAGKHVVCEKPFARDKNEALAMLAAADEAGVVHLVGTEYRWGATQGVATRAIAEGVVGTPRLATFLLFGGFLADPDAGVPDWWGAADQGGGWLQAHAPHLIDQVRSSLGEFAAVSAGLPRVVEHTWAAEDSFSVRFRLTNGVEGVMHESASDWGPPMFMTRIGRHVGNAVDRRRRGARGRRRGDQEAPGAR